MLCKGSFLLNASGLEVGIAATTSPCKQELQREECTSMQKGMLCLCRESEFLVLGFG